MDNQRLILTIALIFVSYLIYQQWQIDYGPKPETPVVQGSGLTETGNTTASTDTLAEIPNVQSGQPVVESSDVLPEAVKTVLVETDVFRFEIDLNGGVIRKAWLLKYPVDVEHPDEPFQLMNDSLPNIFIMQSGLIGSDVNAPNHQTRYQASAERFQLRDGENLLEVPLTWRDAEGVTVTKSFIFKRNSYDVEMLHKISNKGDRDWPVKEYRQLQRTQVAEKGQSSFIYTYMGGAIYSPEDKYQKISFEDMVEGKLERPVTGGWVGMLQHYFVGAIVPPIEQTDIFFTNVLSNARYVIGTVTNVVTVRSGQDHTFRGQMFFGPKLQHDMAAVAPGLDLTVDYGFLTVISQPIFWALEKLYALLGNWGWAIIVLTMLIKLAFYKLSETSYKSMANMRKLAPRLQKLKERYGDDKQRLNQAMMDMYKKEKINPLGGCLPILVQIPVFIALYWVLLESVELRQAPFILWIHDLSIADPYFVLPVIMGISMFIQQKLNPAPLDPMQAKVMMALPFVFTVFFAFFPAGLVLYWVVNNILSITQQAYITRKIEANH